VGIEDDSPDSEWECPSCDSPFRVREDDDGNLYGVLRKQRSTAIEDGESRRRRRRRDDDDDVGDLPRQPTGIDGFDHLSDDEVSRELENGARFVIYSYCISIVVLTFKQSSSVHFVRADESRFLKGLPYTLISLVVGWWGFPFGLIYTPWCIISNCAGGTDVTDEMLSAVPQRRADY